MNCNEFEEEVQDEVILVPEICDQYQSSECQEEESKQKKCQALHLCWNYFHKPSECSGHNCTLSHTIIDQDKRLLSSHGLVPDYPDIMKLLRDLILGNNARPTAKIPDYCRLYSNGNACKDSQCPLVHINKRKESLSSNPKQAWEARCKLLSAGFDTDSKNALKLYFSLEKRKNDASTNPKQCNDTETHSGRRKFAGRCNTDQNFPDHASVLAVKSKSQTITPRLFEFEIEPQVCVDYLQNFCSNDAISCSNVHPNTSSLFVWQYKFDDRNFWNNFPDYENEALEAKYCLPEVEPVPGIIDGQNLKILFWFKDMRTKIFKDIGGTHARLRRVEAPGLRWNYFYRFSRLGHPWRLMRKFNNTGIDSESVHELFENLPPDEIKIHEFQIANYGKESTQKLFMLKTRPPLQFLVFQMSEKASNVKFIKRRPHWNKPSLESYLTDVYPRCLTPISQNPINEEISGSQGTCMRHFEVPCSRKGCLLENKTDESYFWFQRNGVFHEWQELPRESAEILEKHFRNVHIDHVPADEVRTFSVTFANSGQFKCQSSNDENENMQVDLRREHYDCLSWSWYWLEQSTYVPSKVSPAIPELMEYYARPASDHNWRSLDVIASVSQVEQITSRMLEEQYQKYRSWENQKSSMDDTDLITDAHKVLLVPVNGIMQKLDFEHFTLKNLAKNNETPVRRRPNNKDGMELAKNEIWEPSRLKRQIALQYSDIYSGPQYKILQKFFTSVIKNEKPTGFAPVIDHANWDKYQKKRSQIISSRGAEFLNETILLKEIKLPKVHSKEEDNNTTCSSAISNCFKQGSELKCEINSESDITIYARYAIAVLLVCVGKFKRGNDFDEIDINLNDACVDHESKPRRVIVANAEQICPLYIVKYY